MLVHRMVAKTFIGERERPWTPLVDHIDGDNQNNNVSNLRWTCKIVNGLNRSDAKGYTKRASGNYRVQQKLFGKDTNYGTYKTEAEAKIVANNLRLDTIENLVAIEEQMRLATLEEYES